MPYDAGAALFDKYWLCETTKVSLSVIHNVPKEHEVFNPKPMGAGFGIVNREMSRIETCSNEQGVLDMLYGTSRFSIGEEYNESIGKTAAELVSLNTATLASMIYKKGTVGLLNPINSVEIYSDLCTYLEEIKYKGLLEPFYEGPPAEDIEALKNLQSLLEDLANGYTVNNQGDSAMVKLQQLLGGNTATGNLTTNPNKVFLDGFSRTATFGPDYTDETNPYKFSPR